MIQNIIFDMGQVLFRYDPARYVAKRISDPEDAKLVRRELFDHPDWIRLDYGTVTEEEHIREVLLRLPERLWEDARWLFENWDYLFEVIPETQILARDLKQNGYRCFLLSNMGLRYRRFYRRVPATQYLDGTVISAEEHCIKPEPEFYRVLFERYSLPPEECFFIDDRPENIEAGQKLGMPGFIYAQDVEELKTALREAGVRI
jgi:putative hydrolase of the HAD superfamily